MIDNMITDMIESEVDAREIQYLLVNEYGMCEVEACAAIAELSNEIFV